MGMQNPDIGEPLATFSDVFKEGERFYLEGVRTVHVRNTEYGEGEMVVLRVRGQEKELGIWGSYLVAQAKSVQPSDLHKWYVVNRRVIQGFGKGRPVKVFDPPEATTLEDDPPFE